jgi:hypothetical protein
MNHQQTGKHGQAEADAMKRDFENARDGKAAKAERAGTAGGLSPPPTLELKPNDIRAKDAQKAAGLTASFNHARDASPALANTLEPSKNIEIDQANALGWEDDQGYGLSR